MSEQVARQALEAALSDLLRGTASSRGELLRCWERYVAERDLALRYAAAAAGGQPPSDGTNELEQIRKIVLALCDEPEDDSPYVIVGESGMPIVEADTLPQAIEQIIACWNAAAERGVSAVPPT